MADALVTCIIKPDRNSPHEHITNLGGNGWCWDVQSVIASIEAKTNTFYTQSGNKRADIKVRIRDGRKYVQTVEDGLWTDNLLSLETCPVQ